MSNPEYHIVGSILTVNASGVQDDVEKDLQLPDGKSIAELLDDQKEKNQENNNSGCE